MTARPKPPRRRPPKRQDPIVAMIAEERLRELIDEVMVSRTRNQADGGAKLEPEIEGTGEATENPVAATAPDVKAEMQRLAAAPSTMSLEEADKVLARTIPPAPAREHGKSNWVSFCEAIETLLFWTICIIGAGFLAGASFIIGAITLFRKLLT